MLLAIDIGNTNTVVGAFINGQLKEYFRVASNHALTVDECGFFVTGILGKMQLNAADIKSAVIASVVPRLTSVYDRMSRKYLSVTPLIVSSDIKLPIKIDYTNPSEVGADRIANAVAAFAQTRTACIVVDFGTATTFDIIDDQGVYLGGVICPGAETSGASLALRAARLFEVGLEKPDNVIGKTTAEAIKSGLFYGTVGQVDKIIELIINEMKVKPVVIATGGLASQFFGHSRFIDSCDPGLTLDGLKIIFDFQSK